MNIFVNILVVALAAHPAGDDLLKLVDSVTYDLVNKSDLVNLATLESGLFACHDVARADKVNSRFRIARDRFAQHEIEMRTRGLGEVEAERVRTVVWSVLLADHPAEGIGYTAAIQRIELTSEKKNEICRQLAREADAEK